MKKKNPIISYFRESKQELEKVSWPTQKETIRYTVATIVITLLFAVLFAVLDAGLSLGLNELINLSGGSSTVPSFEITPTVQTIEGEDGTIEVIDGTEDLDGTNEESEEASNDEESTDDSNSEDDNE